MHVHFVCVGNTYRSRLAEALLNARELPGVRATSSGIRASENLNGPVSWQALRLLKNHGLIPHMSPHWTQTSAAVLAAADLVVFMEPACRQYCAEQYGFAGDCEVWDVPDAGYPFWDGRFDELEGDARSFAINEETFAMLRALVEDLARRLSA
ncbi:MAG TPA: hypothetical protein VFA70_10775 [Dehalococcoidia bacterium]|nr:hypothetical protein [Dehalococcoidia bacterium]